MGKQAERKNTKPVRRRIAKAAVRGALVSSIKSKSGRKDIVVDDAARAAEKIRLSTPPKERAGYPLKISKGAVEPERWKTKTGVEVEVDFSRCHWLPDDWGQGIKRTKKTILKARPRRQGGGVLTTFVAPNGVDCFFHKDKVEEYVGRKLTKKDGLNGQIRSCKLAAATAIAVAKEEHKLGDTNFRMSDADENFFAILTKEEQKNIPKESEFHFCVISGRRATNPEGIQDIFVVQSLLDDAGIKPTWYVDEKSYKEYNSLGLKAEIKVGGKLIPSRNMALADARHMDKICVQVSDDISSWQYRHGKRAARRDDKLMNEAHDKAKRFYVSPMAAAQFIAAKMRSATDPKPKLGGVYPVGSCSRTFASDPFSRYNFILGDFFVVDKGSLVNFDTKMSLKEDYDFTCSHIQAHGSVLRCQRMTLSVKHYDNAGGAVSYRKKGEEMKNIKILNKKWPGQFTMNTLRKSGTEVRLRWTGPKLEDVEDDGIDAEDEVVPGSSKSTTKGKKATKAFKTAKSRMKAKNKTVKMMKVMKKMGSKKKA